jgi:hypothetical protein
MERSHVIRCNLTQETRVYAYNVDADVAGKIYRTLGLDVEAGVLSRGRGI